MTQTTLNDISRAAADKDLLDRIIAAAAEYGVENPEGWTRMNARRIAAAIITTNGDTIASVLAYAIATHKPAPTPGANPAAVTDAYIRTAVADIHQRTTTL